MLVYEYREQLNDFAFFLQKLRKVYYSVPCIPTLSKFWEKEKKVR